MRRGYLDPRRLVRSNQQLGDGGAERTAVLLDVSVSREEEDKVYKKKKRMKCSWSCWATAHGPA